MSTTVENPRVAELQQQIAELSARLIAELADAPAAIEAPAPTDATPVWLSVADFADRLRVSRRTVWRLIEGGLPYERPRPRVIRIPVARAEAWIAKRQAAERPESLDVPSESVR